MRTFRHPSASHSEPGVTPNSSQLEHIYAQYLDAVYGFLYARVGNREDAEDLTSQVFLKAFRQLDTARPQLSIASWLFTVARTILADHWREQYRYGPLAELDENVMDRGKLPGTSDEAEAMRRVDQALACLPARSRAVLELRFLRGYTIEETARTLGITAGNVKIIQHRALARAADLTDGNRECGATSAAEGQAIA